MFNKFLEYYYQSQEKTGLGQNIVNNYLNYLDIDKLDIGILDGATKIVEPITADSDTIVVESVDEFLETNGSVLVGSEVIFYESVENAPNISLSPGISYEQVKLKWTVLANIINQFDGTTQRFNLTSRESPISAPSVQHLVVSVYGRVLIPQVDYQLDGTSIVFTEAPRTRTPSDDDSSTYIFFLSGFIENPIVQVDDISGSFGEGKTSFTMTRGSLPYEPTVDEYVIAVYDNRLLVPKVDFFIDGSNFIFNTPPVNGRIVSIYSIEAPIPSFGSGAIGYSRVNDVGEITKVSVNANGSNYRFEYPPQVSINSATGGDGSVSALINGVKTLSLLEGGQGYSETNPPTLQIESPTKEGSTIAVLKATVTEGSISAVEIESSGSGYTFTPRVTIKQPGGAKLGFQRTGVLTVNYTGTIFDFTVGQTISNSNTISGKVATVTAFVRNGNTGIITYENTSAIWNVGEQVYVNNGPSSPTVTAVTTPTIINGSIATPPTILDTGFGYTTVPEIYIDEPTGVNGIRATMRAVLTDGEITGIEVINSGQGYLTTPRIAVIDPVGAKVLETTVDGTGRVIGVELLSGGLGYTDVPSVYVVDDRVDGTGQYIGGTGATATAQIFNGRITDINITNFGSGYSADEPPVIVIQDPPTAKISAEIGLNQITGFKVNKPGNGYTKAALKGCARAASGIVAYTEEGNAVFSNDTIAVANPVDTEVKCLDALFVKRLLDKYKEQYLPDIPELDYKRIDVRTAIKSIRDFYQSKGTSFSISYLFKLLYGEQVSITYPKDQIIKPSAATWSINTILRATLVSGDPDNIQDGLLIQEEDIADPNVLTASALVENFISIKTSDTEIYELALSEETITGTFTVPYKTRLAEPLNTTESIITVDSTIGWPERNGEFLIGGTELVRYKEKSLNQFIECTRSSNNIVEDWDSATEVTSNFTVFINKGTPQEVVMNVVGIVDAQQTTLTDTGSYYLPGDKLTVSKLGGSSTRKELTTWLYNVKKLVSVTSVTYGGVNNDVATIVTENPHGLLVGDQVTVYGANPIIYNGTFLVTSRDNETQFQYQLPQPAQVIPQGNILISVDLNKGKSDNAAVNNAIKSYTTNVQNSFFNDNYVYIASTGIPNYNIGPFPGSAFLPGNQRKLNRFPLAPVTISTKDSISPGPIGTWVNGVSIWSYKSQSTKTFGSVTSIDITNRGENYDAATPPVITISGGGGTGATASVVVDGSLDAITVNGGGSGYTSSPLVSIVGGGGSGASATAIITKGVVSRVLINTPGSGYTSQPTVSIVGGGGTGATATAEVRGPIKQINVTSAGSSYTSEPSVTLSSGSGAVAQAVVQNGRIISIARISGGSGYTTAPEVTIQGEGFGAVARAVIAVDGPEAGKVTGIEIINRGIGYVQGTTVVSLNSIGQGATFSSNVFQWTYNLQRTSVFDAAQGSVFDGYNTQYGGEYAHLSNPQRLRFILGDNLTDNQGTITEVDIEEATVEHSPIIGWAFDGNPIYGPYGYSDPTDQGSTIRKLDTSYRLRRNLTASPEQPFTDTDGTVFTVPFRIDGPSLNTDAAGVFIDDYEYIFNLGDLDQYNGRFCKTPEFASGRYCYFVTIDATEQGNPEFPYILGPSFNSVVDKWNLDAGATQQNIPTGVVRYRDPYENVDIDIDRAPNVSTNALTTEAGDILLFEIEDENKDGSIDVFTSGAGYTGPVAPAEFVTVGTSGGTGTGLTIDIWEVDINGAISRWGINEVGTGYVRGDVVTINGGTTSATVTLGDEYFDPDQVFEESPLQLFDYFPKVKFDSKVDIEVETTTKFEDASVTGFTIENPGQNYQVNDRLVFDNTDTDGDGVSARISRIAGETVESYDYETISGVNYGVLTTDTQHNLVAGDTVFVDYSPLMDSTNKTYTVRQYKGIEEIIVNQTGSGYNEDIPPTITIDGDGTTPGTLEAIVTSVGSIDTVNIKNSGSGYTKNPRVILSHPQVFKKADYYTALINNNDYVRVNDVFIAENKEAYICGLTKNSSSEEVAFIAKLSATGVKEWEKTLESQTGLNYAEFKRILVDGNTIYAVGINKPNAQLFDNKNPDVILAKYTQSADGLSATLDTQRAYAGISGSTRFDDVTSIVKISDTRIAIGGYTNTNSGNPYDAYIAVLDTTGTFTVKRKLASESLSEKITSMVFNEGAIFFTMEVAQNTSSTDVNLAMGKATPGVSAIEVDYIKQYSNTTYSTLDTSIATDEFNEYYLTTTLRSRTDTTVKDAFAVVKVDNTGAIIWNKIYRPATNETIGVVNKTSVDIFGDLNVVYNHIDPTTKNKTIRTVKIKYNGDVLKHTSNDFVQDNVEGAVAYGMTSDNSGDVYAYGQIQWNRNEFLLDMDQAPVDITQHYTPTATGTVAYTATGTNISGWDGSAYETQYITIPGSELGTKLDSDWTVEFFMHKDATQITNNAIGATKQTLFAIGDANDATGGLILYYDTTGSGANNGKLHLAITDSSTVLRTASGALLSPLANMFADDTWQTIGITKSGTSYTVYVNGISVITGTQGSTSFANKDVYFGHQPGWNGTTGQFRADEQGQFYLNHIRLRNRVVTPTVPSDIQALPTSGAFALGYTWTDTAWFTNNIQRYDYIDQQGFGLKTDKGSDAVRIGTFASSKLTRTTLPTTIAATTGLTLGITDFVLGDIGFQSLDYDQATTTMNTNTETLTYSNNIWSSRTATVPSPGSQKLSITAVVKDRYYFKLTGTTKIDNILRLSINQSFDFTVGTKLVLNEGSSQRVSGYIIAVDEENNTIDVGITISVVSGNSWSNYLNVGELSTVQFSEQSSYNIVGPIPNDTNEFAYTFANVEDTTVGNFTIALNTFDAPAAIGGTNNLNLFGKFKPYAEADYNIRIEEVSGTSPYIVGSVVSVPTVDDGQGNLVPQISYNSDYSSATITNLTGVTKISLIANLSKIVNVTGVTASDSVYVITSSAHYLDAGDMIFIDGNPTRTVGEITYDEYDGAFAVDRVISPLEFVYKLPQAAVTLPADSAGTVSVFTKSPTIKMYYGHQYIFDVSHSSMTGGNLSFSKDNLYKLEYSFNSIERFNTPGQTGAEVKLKVDRDIVTNISYYFDPSRTGADSPVIPGSYLDVVTSPYKGTFQISSTSGGTITTGDDTFKFILANEPEAEAIATRASYSTSSVKAVGSINSIRIVNPGGFYKRLPVVSNIISSRKIERVEINEPGTQYNVGTYNGIAIAGDGEGGLVSVTVANTLNNEGVTVPGQVTDVTITSPGKGYTTASIDIDGIAGIGADTGGSGAEVQVIIPPFGTGASIFTVGENVGKIKKLKNNNFGYDYPHDYTLRPEITFPINAQLTSTSILDSITVTDPGSGYSQPPAVVITGGGGEGAIAEATIKNGRLDQIFVKDAGAGYSSTPTVNLKSSFNYVVNLDLGLLQFAFPHGIQNGAAVTLNVVDTGEGAEFPLAAGAIGRLNSTTTYYAIAGTAQSLEDNQLKLAITANNADLGDAITFATDGTGRQQILTESFGGSAEANVITSTFLEGELVYQGDSLDQAIATGYVSTNDGWQIGPRILKIVDYNGTFSEGESITGVISKSSGTISSLKIAKGVLEIGSITKTTGQFIDDIGKPSEIIQKIQDSYYYQEFSYAVKSAVSINEWKEILIRNVHPASFKVFGELNLSEYGSIPNKETSFQLTKSVELARQAIFPNIQSFALVEPIYSEFNNTEILFRQKRLTSSENILTSTVQRLDDISSLFDGERIAFPLTVSEAGGAPQSVIASEEQLMIVLNGVVQTPGTAFEVQGENLVFAEPPQPAASVKYANVDFDTISTVDVSFANISGIFPTAGMIVVGSATSPATQMRVTNVIGDTIRGFICDNEGNPVTTNPGTFLTNELVNVTATGFSAFVTSVVPTVSQGLFIFGEKITAFDGDTATVESINLDSDSNQASGKLRFTIGQATTSFEIVSFTGVPTAYGTSATLTSTGYENRTNVPLVGGRGTGLTATWTVNSVGTIVSLTFDATNATGYVIGDSLSLPGGNSITVTITDIADAAPAADAFEVGKKYQFGPERFLINTLTTNNDSITVTVTRDVDTPPGTSFQASRSAGTPIYGTEVEVTNTITLSKTTGTYQSTPGLFSINIGDYIIAGESGVVARVTGVQDYTDPVTSNDIDRVIISGASTFFGLLFNRIPSTTYPNVVIDDISKSQVSIVDFDDNLTSNNTDFPTEFINNYVIAYNNLVGGPFQQDEILRNFKLDYGSNSGNFIAGESAKVKKLTLVDRIGEGFFNYGQNIRTRDTKAEVISYNAALKTVYLGKTGRSKRNGQDYFQFTFNAGASLNTYNEKFGTACLALSPGTSPHTFVSGVADAITAGSGATGTFTAAAGTTYDPFSGDMVIEIGAHTLTTSNTVLIADDGVVFTCAQDNNTSNKAYPRSTDPQSGQNIPITAVTATTITVNVGAVPIDEYVSTPTNEELGFATGSFTIECWIKPNSVATGQKYIWDLGDNSNTMQLTLNGSVLNYTSHNGATITGTTNLVAGTWYHVAVVRGGTTIKLFLDGVQESTDLTDSSNFGTTKPMKIGSDDAGANCFPGYIDELRISNNNRYTTTFTPRNGTFQGDVNTKMLVHFDGTYGQTYTEDWSGVADFTADEYFNNDALLATNRSSSASPAGFTGNSHRYINAADNILLNKDFIAQEAVYIMKERYPYFTVPGGAVNCEDDVRDILDAVVADLRNGSNSHVWDAAALYIDQTQNPITLNHIETEIPETLYTLQKAEEIVRYVINNVPWRVQGNHGRTQKFDTSITESDYATLTQFTPTGATYDPATGDMVITSAGHGLNAEVTSASPTGATYDATTGVMQLTIANHGFANGDRIRLVDDSLTFTCTSDGNTANKTYPRANDPASQGWLEVSNVSTNTFEVNVGPSPTVNYEPTDATYDPATGLLVLTLPENNLEVGQSISLTTDSLTFTCTQDNNGSNHTYPRSSDPAANTSLPILQNGLTKTATAASYNASSGVLVVTSAAHGFAVGDKIRIEDNSLTFTCSRDLNATNHTYPRSTDPASGRWLRVTAVSTDTFTVNVGASSADDQYTHTFVSATANGIVKKNNTITVNVGASGANDQYEHTFVSATSNAVVAGGNYTHTFVSASSGVISAPDSVYLATESITFTCAQDGNTFQTAYPRSTDPAAKQILEISATTTDTFTINVGASPVGKQYAHTFVSAASNAVSKTEYDLGDCVDVKNTVNTLMSIISDTLTNATLSPAVNHLATVTKLEPVYEFVGATVDAYLEVPFDIEFADSVNERVFTNQIDLDTQNRFRDAANLITLNTRVIVDKASYDLLNRYPDLASEMPRNNVTAGSGTLRCQQDLTLIVQELVKDIENGGNAFTVQVAKQYLDSNNEIRHIRLQVWQSQYAHERLAYYMKQAIRGELTTDNTSNIIIGPWGITVDGSTPYCANVATAIDGLVQTLNDIVAPATDDTFIAADRLYFNRQYIAEEITGLTTNEFTYSLGATTYNAFTYPEGGELKCQRDLKLILLSIISDMQTGGNNSTIQALDNYFNADGTLNYIEDELLATVYSIEQLKLVGEYAIRDALYQFNTGVTTPTEYYALYTDELPVNDSLVISDINKVINKFDELVDLALNYLAPGKLVARETAKNLLYNRNYYLSEATNLVDTQFGSNTWTTEYTTFLDQILNDTVHDIVTTNTLDKKTVMYITVNSASSNFTIGETVTGGTTNATGKVLEWSADDQALYVEVYTGTFNNASETLTGSTSSFAPAINAAPVSVDYYNNLGNVKTLRSLTSLRSNISGTLPGTNLWLNPEQYATNWTTATTVSGTETTGTGAFVNDTVAAPDDTQTADKISFSDSATGTRSIFRSYNLTSFATFDTTNLKFDTTNETFDTGSPSNAEDKQRYTVSSFVKAENSAGIRYKAIIGRGTSAEQSLFFDLDFSNGQTSTSIFRSPSGSLEMSNGEIILFTADVSNDSQTSTANREPGTYTFTSVTSQNSGSTGTLSEWEVIVDQAYNTSVRMISGGTGFTSGDTIRLTVGPENGNGQVDDIVITVDTTRGDFGVTPYGNGWFRVYIDTAFGYGFPSIDAEIIVKSSSGAQNYDASVANSNGIYVWGAKLTKSALDPYQAQSGEIFYSDIDFNIRNYTLDLLRVYFRQAIVDGLTDPGATSGLQKIYFTPTVSVSEFSIRRFGDNIIDLYKAQLLNNNYYLSVAQINGIVTPTKDYGVRDIPAGMRGGVVDGESFYAELSNNYGTIESKVETTGKVVQVYKRFRIDGDITDGPFTMGESVSKVGDATTTGVVYSFTSDENYKYLDVRVTAGTWAALDQVVGAENSTTATINVIEDRLHIIDLTGEFIDSVPFKGYTSAATATPTSFINNSAAVITNNTGTLVVDTDSLVGTFDKTAVVYPANSREYLTVKKYDGFDIAVGDRIASAGHIRLQLSVLQDLDNFTVGNRLYRLDSSSNQDSTKYGIITGVDIDNNFIYYRPFVGGEFTAGEAVGDYGLAGAFPVGYASVVATTTTTGAAAGLVQDIRNDGLNLRLYLSDIIGTFDENSGIIGPDDYKAAIVTRKVLRARVKRASKGFDGTTNIFDLTITNGTDYFPDSAGHMMIFINGILQPPGSDKAYTAYSNKIEFNEPPETGATFTGFYLGKMRQLDDISFEFDSLRQSFNLKRNETFYSLTVTDGVQSSTILPENNIIVSVNGVIQEPGVGFEIVGSRINFSEIPRVGSTFVAFAYVGSEADVDAAEVVPPIEPGDLLSVQGETEDREVAVIESSNSLITFDYLGSVFGQNARATATIKSGYIETVSVTAGGSGYTSRPAITLTPINGNGSGGQVRALVGVAGVEVLNQGSGYQNPAVEAETTVPDDWTAPDLSLYGEELVDPEIL